VLSIADEGIGIQSTPAPGSTGMGQRIVSAMANKLNASVEHDSSAKGTRVTLKFNRADPPKSKIKAATD
jgi:two-component sensor histidine kinase